MRWVELGGLAPRFVHSDQDAARVQLRPEDLKEPPIEPSIAQNGLDWAEVGSAYCFGCSAVMQHVALLRGAWLGCSEAGRWGWIGRVGLELVEQLAGQLAVVVVAVDAVAVAVAAIGVHVSVDSLGVDEVDEAGEQADWR